MTDVGSRAALLIVLPILLGSPPARADGPAGGEQLGGFTLFEPVEASVDVPAVAGPTFRVREPSGMEIEATLLDAGVTVQLTKIPEGVEANLGLMGATGVSFRLELTKVAGLRLAGQILELLDEQGAPRLRVIQLPEPAEPTFQVEECPFDDSAVPPWGRQTTPLDPSECTLSIDTSGTQVRLRFETTGQIGMPRWSHAAVALGGESGAAQRVMVLGGVPPEAGGAIASAEIFDLATSTWASAGSMASRRARHTAYLLDGRVIVIGGAADHSKRIELFDPAEGWSHGPETSVSRAGHAAVLLDDAVLVTGGHDTAAASTPLDSVERVSATAVDSTLPLMKVARDGHTATLLHDGRVLVVAGVSDRGVTTGHAELWWDGEWHPAGAVSPRMQHAACALPSGDVLIAGGQLATDVTVAVADASPDVFRFDASSGGFLPLSPMSSPVTGPGATRVGPLCLLTGGASHAGTLAPPTHDARTFDESAGDEMKVTHSMHFERRNHSVTSLPGARMLVLGGEWVGLQGLRAAELFSGVCLDEHTAPDVDRGAVECAPYTCSKGACRASCETVLDCAEPAICDRGRCAAPPQADFGGCSCAQAGRGAGAPFFPLALASVAALRTLISRSRAPARARRAPSQGHRAARHRNA